jgi:hypothetical protein
MSFNLHLSADVNTSVALSNRSDPSTGRWHNFNDESVTPLGGGRGDDDSSGSDSGRGRVGSRGGGGGSHRAHDSTVADAGSGVGGVGGRGRDGGGGGGGNGSGVVHGDDHDDDGGIDDLSFFVKAFGGRSDGASSASAYVLLYHRIESERTEDTAARQQASDENTGDTTAHDQASECQASSKKDVDEETEPARQRVDISAHGGGSGGGGGDVPPAIAHAIAVENDKWRADREAYLKRKNSVHFEVHHPGTSATVQVSVDKASTLADATRAAAAAVLGDASALADGVELRLRPCHLKTGKPTAPPLCVLETLGTNVLVVFSSEVRLKCFAVAWLHALLSLPCRVSCFLPTP